MAMPMTGKKPTMTAAGAWSATAAPRVASVVAMVYAGAVLETAMTVESMSPSAP